MSVSETQAGVREAARERGGDALVKKVDAAFARERAFEDVCKKLEADALAIADEEERALAIVALNEALSTAIGRTAVLYGKMSKQSDGQVIVTAVRSVSNSIQISFQDRDAESNDIGGKLAALKTTLGPLPDKDEEEK